MSETSPHDPGPEAAGDRGERHATAAREPLTIGGATVRIGTASWTDPTMTAPGVFYPPDASTAEDRLVYYANQFPIVEVDATYYALPVRRQGELWLERTPPDFTFDIKAHALMTGQPSEPKRLPKDLREALPAEIAEQKRVYARDLPNEIEDEIWARFLDGIEPLRSSGKLGAVFLQYPRWFFPSNESRDEIAKAKERLGDTPFAVELRHGSWLNDKNRERTVGFFEKYEIPFVMVDAPPGTRSSLPPMTVVTSPKMAVVRFHGRRTRDVGEVRHPRRGAIPLPLRRGRARRVGAADPRDRRAGAGDPRADEQLLRELRHDERARDRRPAGLRGAAARPLTGYPWPVGNPSRAVPILVALVLAGCVLPPPAPPTPTPSLDPFAVAAGDVDTDIDPEPIAILNSRPRRRARLQGRRPGHHRDRRAACPAAARAHQQRRHRPPSAWCRAPGRHGTDPDR